MKASWSAVAPGHSSLSAARRPRPGPSASSASPHASARASAGAQGVQASTANGSSPPAPSSSSSGQDGGSPTVSAGHASAGASTSPANGDSASANGDSARPTPSNQCSLISGAPQDREPLLEVAVTAAGAAAGTPTGAETGDGARSGCPARRAPGTPAGLPVAVLMRVPVADCQRSMMRFTSMFSLDAGPLKTVGRNSAAAAGPVLKRPSSIPHSRADIG